MSLLDSNESDAVKLLLENGQNNDGLKELKAIRLALVFADEKPGVGLKSFF